MAVVSSQRQEWLSCPRGKQEFIREGKEGRAFQEAARAEWKTRESKQFTFRK